MNELYEETDRAEEERSKDAARARFIIEKHTSSLDYDLEPNSSSFPSTTLTSQNKRPYQEDRAGSHRIKIQCPANVLEGKEVLEEVISILAKHTHNNIPGSTLVASICWIEDASHWIRKGAKVVYVLTANLGDSRALICRAYAESTYEAVTRLTCEHTLDRQHEVEHHGVTLKEISEKETHIYSGDTLIGRQITKDGGVHFFPFMETNIGLAMTRSLGDARLHHSPLFSRIPSISLVSYEIDPKKDIYLITLSDGITGAMTDEELAEIIMSGEDKTFTEAAEAIAKKAKIRGAHDNLSVVIAGLHNILQGEVLLQFVADGHGGTETSQFVADNIEVIFNYVMLKKRLTPCQLHHFRETIAQAESGTVSYTTTIMTIEYYLIREPRYKAILEDRKYKPFLDIIGQYYQDALAEKITYYEALHKTLWDLYEHFGEDSRIKDLFDTHRANKNISFSQIAAKVFEIITELHMAQAKKPEKRPYPGFDYTDPALVPTQKKSSQSTQLKRQP